MGAFGTGFLGSIGDAVHQKAALARANEQKQKDAEAQYHWEAMKARLAQGGTVNPNTKEFVPFSQEQRDSLIKEGTDNMAKAYGGSKPVKELMQHAQQLIGKATNHPLWGHPGSENMQKDATPAATATPTASQASATGIPAPPGLQAQAAAPGLDSRGASDVPPAMDSASAAPDAAPAVSSPTSALASASQGLSDGKSASSVDLSGASGGPSDVDQSQNQQVAPQPSSDATAVARGTTLSPPPSSKAANAAVAPQGLSPAAVPIPAAGIAPPPGVPPAAAGVASWNPTGHQLMNSFISPYDTARLQGESQNAVELHNKQAAFDQGLAQREQTIASYKKLLGRDLTPTEVLQVSGIKLPAAMFTPHFNSKVVLSENAAANGVMSDGSLPSDHPGKILQIVGGSPMSPVYGVTDMQPKIEKEGNLNIAYNPITMERLGAISDTPVRTGTSTSRVAPVTTMGTDGRIHQYAGSTSNTPTTVASPLMNSGGVPPPPSKTRQTVPVATPDGATVSAPAGTAKKSQHPIMAAGAATTAAANQKTPGAGPTPARSLGEGEIPSQMYAAQQKRNTAINGAGQALVRFSAPQEDGMSNLEIFKDPAAINRVASYLKMNNDQIEGQFEQAEKSGAAGIASFYVGLPQAYASASTSAVQDVYSKMTPREKRFVTDYYALLGQWGGMRAASGASGSLWNFRNLSQEIPNPMSITSYEEAVRKVRDNAAEIAQTAKPNTIATKYTEKDFLPQEQGKKVKSVLPAPPSKSAAAASNNVRPRPKAGDVVDGHKFNGGNPNDPNNWEEVKKK